ncbi:MAG: hypothetical protein JO222_14060 [Frankiales bacterium]|nr:hypothetical protein [Frankiales bacterium]
MKSCQPLLNPAMEVDRQARIAASKRWWTVPWPGMAASHGLSAGRVCLFAAGA